MVRNAISMSTESTKVSTDTCKQHIFHGYAQATNIFHGYALDYESGSAENIG
jgi:hypothetical protein